MEHNQIFKQMVDFNRGTFTNAYNAMVMVQDQTEALANTVLNQAAWLPEEGRSAIQEWVGALKKGREAFKQSIDESFNQAEAFFKPL